MPEMTPVGNTNTPPNVGQTINQFSQLLGYRQQQQELRKQTASANVAEQSAKENQGIAQLLQDPVGNGILDSDGNPTKDAQQIILKVAPTTGSQHIDGIYKAAKSKVDFNQSVNNLNLQERGEVIGALSGPLADPNAKPDDVRTALSSLVESKKGTPAEADYKRIADTYNHVLDKAIEGNKATIQAPGKEAWRTGLIGINRSILSPDAVSGPGGLLTPQSGSVDTGTAIQPGTVAPAVQGGGFTPAGAPIQKSAFGTNQLGQSVVTTPRGVVALGGDNPTRPQAEAVGAVASGITNRVQQVQAAANNTTQAQDALTRALNIVDAPGGFDTGKLSTFKKDFGNVLASAGIDISNVTDANLLAKNLARYEAARATQAGLGGTDAARELAHNGSPNVSVDKTALRGMISQSLATEKALASYANVQARAGADVQRLAANEAAFRSIPNLIEGYEYGMMRTPQEADAFLAKHGLTKADMAKTRQAIKAFESQ